VSAVVVDDVAERVRRYAAEESRIASFLRHANETSKVVMPAEAIDMPQSSNDDEQDELVAVNAIAQTFVDRASTGSVGEVRRPQSTPFHVQGVSKQAQCAIRDVAHEHMLKLLRVSAESRDRRLREVGGEARAIGERVGTALLAHPARHLQ